VLAQHKVSTRKPSMVKVPRSVYHTVWYSVLARFLPMNLHQQGKYLPTTGKCVISNKLPRTRNSEHTLCLLACPTAIQGGSRHHKASLECHRVRLAFLLLRMGEVRLRRKGGAEGKLLAIRLFDAVVTLLLALELYLAFSLR